ncbi:hypothetical protein [Caballeronia sordidicola]|uniref:hypothetical protein n=1 Tax=Caballeronia sordidicola TaxID=196367 RepID=UPI0012FD48FC|nr:hypothetical protein [Caballeronia sordidicola]
MGSSSAFMPGCCFFGFRAFLAIVLLSTISHCPWRDFISFSNGEKETNKENAFQPLILKWTKRAVSSAWDFKRTVAAITTNT